MCLLRRSLDDDLIMYREDREGVYVCWQPAKVGQLRTREIICYEEALVSSLRVLL